MGTALLLFLMFGLPAILSVAGIAASTIGNSVATEKTNQTNVDIARETNAANAEQADLAYQRSLPINQVADLMAAGMSKPAALNKLSGGGTYTAPVMQSAQAQSQDFSSLSQLSEIGERLQNVPANVQQRKLVDEQIAALKQETQQKKIAFEREMQERAQRMLFEKNEELRKQYGQKAVEASDKLRSKIVDLATSKGVPLSSLRSEDDLLKLGVGDLPEWKNAPAMARDNALAYVRSNASEYRAQSAENRTQDDWNYHKEFIRTQEFEKLLNENTKLRQQNLEWFDSVSSRWLERMKHNQEVAEWFNSADIRNASNDVQRINLIAEKKMAQLNLSKEELKNSFRWQWNDKTQNYEPTLIEQSASKARDFWNWVGSMVGIDNAGAFIRSIIQ